MLGPGTCLNHSYTLIEEIGSGGGGVVYKAYHENLRKYVVVKQIKDVAKNVLDSRAEADILKNLRNTYLPQVYDFLEIDGEIFTVIDYIEGESLDKVLKKEQRFDQKKVLKWAGQLAEALAYLHRQVPPIIHSDIKPANIMLTPKEDICLIDFNVSLAFDMEKRRSTGISEGYSPPEQYWDYGMYCSLVGIDSSKRASGTTEGSIRKTEMISVGGASVREDGGITAQDKNRFIGNSRFTEALIGKGVDERSDIYSLGATLYHLLTGIYPAKDFEKIIPINQCKVNISEGLSFIIQKMMELSPENRYQNGAEALEAIRNIRKLDTFYRRYRSFCFAAGFGVAVLYVCSALVLLIGTRMLRQEKKNWYNTTIEKAENLSSTGELEMAKRYIEEAMTAIPTRIEAYKAEILRLYESADYEECISYGTKTVNSPEYYVENENDRKQLGDILYVMGNAYYETDDMTNAQICLEMAISYNSENSAYYRDLSIIQAKKGNLSEAEETLKIAEELGLGQDSIYMVQGEIAYAASHPEEAVAFFQKALNLTELNGIRRRCVILCARAYEMLGDSYVDQKIQLLETWRNKLGAGNSMQITEELAKAYAEVRQPKKALEMFLELNTQGYSTYQIMRNIAVLYQEMDQYDEAKNMLLSMVAQYPKRYETYKQLAFLEADIQQGKENNARNYTKMREWYEKAEGLYQQQEAYDGEMQQLKTMLQELDDGGWFD